MDECKNCTVKGDLGECLVTPCRIRNNWFAITILEQNAALKREIEDLKAIALTAIDINIRDATTKKNK